MKMSRFAILLALGCTSCVTMIRGTTQEIRVTSTPSGAHFSLGGRTGTTPATVTVERSGRRDLLLQCSKPGHAPATQNLSPRESESAGLFALYILDALLIVPGTVDLAASAFWQYPAAVHCTLPVAEPGRVGSVSIVAR